MKVTSKKKTEYFMNGTENCIYNAFRNMCYDILGELPPGDIHDNVKLLLQLSEKVYCDFMIELEDWEYGRFQNGKNNEWRP